VCDDADVEAVWSSGLLADPRCLVLFDPDFWISMLFGFGSFEAAFCERGFGGY
jgi:hypothetical protein